MIMDFGTFVEKLRLGSEEAETLFPGFEDSSRLFPGSGDEIETLSPAYLDMVLPWIGLPSEDEAMLRRFAERVKKDPVASLLFFHAERTLFFRECDPKTICVWPEFKTYFGAEHPLFYLLLSCAVFAPTLRNYRDAGLPEPPVHRIGAKISSSSWINRQAFGVPGYARQAIYWLRHYVNLKVIPVGRFEFRHNTAQLYGVEVFRRKSDGALLALFGPKPCGFRADGSGCPLDDPLAVSSGGTIWMRDAVVGHALAPETGRALGVVRLPLAEWAPVITAASPILEWHIPGGGGMTPEVTIASLKEGLSFFDRYFQQLPSPVAVMCSSWAFWHRYEELHPQANPALVMRECYEFNRPPRGFNGFYFIFGANNPDELPGEPRRDTSIRRTMLDVLESEGALGVGGVFILRDDLQRWGSAPYRTVWRCSDWRRYLVSGQ